MKTLRRTSQFKNDVKRMEKRGKDFSDFKTIIVLLASRKQIDAKYRDHPLFGQYTGTRKCHIEPDWLLIYESTDEELVLIRTGTNSDLFNE